MRNFMFVGSVLALWGFSAGASVRPDYVLAQIEEVSDPDFALGESQVTVSVTYWVQPCASQQFKQFVVGDTRDATGTRHIRVGVLIYDSGLACAGPTAKETKQLRLKGNFRQPPDVQALH